MLGHRRMPALLMACAMFVAVGCQNSPPSQSATTGAAPDRAVVVTAGNGGATTVFLPSTDRNSPVILGSSDMAVCPECKAAAIKYFQTGVLDPKCSRTGATRTAATSAAGQEHIH